MSKDFEKAYRELAQTEVPDLWDRIEAGLTEKSAPEKALNIEETASGEKAAKQENSSKEFEAEIEKKEQQKKKPIVVFLKRYSTAVAAIVCVAILIPAISLIGSFGVGGSKSAESESMSLPAAEAPAQMADMEMAEGMMEETLTEEAAAEEAPAEMTEECAAEAPAEVTEECAAEEAPAEVTEEYAAEEAPLEKEEMKAEEAVTTEKAEAEKMSDDLRSENGVSSGAGYDYADKESMVADDLAERCPEGTQVSKVQVEVLRIVDGEEYFAETGKEEWGQIYYVKVLSCPDELLTQDEQIAIFISEHYSMALIEGKRYELTLSSVTEEGKCYFLIEKFHQRLTNDN